MELKEQLSDVLSALIYGGKIDNSLQDYRCATFYFTRYGLLSNLDFCRDFSMSRKDYKSFCEKLPDSKFYGSYIDEGTLSESVLPYPVSEEYVKNHILDHLRSYQHLINKDYSHLWLWAAE